MKARQAVRVSRLELDAAKQTYVTFPSTAHVDTDHLRFNSLKNATPTKQEHARLEVENAEDDLVQKTEVAITLMKAVLDNVRRNSAHDSADRLPPCLCAHWSDTDYFAPIARAHQEPERARQSPGSYSRLSRLPGG